MEYFDYRALAESVRTLNPEQHYWMVRTMGGCFYGDFIRNGYIAFGFDEIALQDLQQLPDEREDAKNILKDILAERREDIVKTGYYASQLLHFYCDVKVGDIVIIPSTGANHVAIGVVQSDVYEEERPVMDNNDYCSFRKRRRVEWKTSARRSTLPPALCQIFSSRHAICSVNSYSSYIDSTVHDCYYKNDTMNLVLKIRTQQEVTLKDFLDLQALDKLVEDFCRCYMGEIADDSRITMKIQMESPGWLKLSTRNVFKLLVFGLVTTSITGGGIKFKTDDGFELYTNGIPGAINEYLDRKADRELIEAAANAIDSLQIKEPKDLQPIIEILDKKNQGREKY